MEQQRLAQTMLAESTAGGFLALVGQMTASHPHPDGPKIRLTATLIDGGMDLGSVDVDVTNLWDLGERARARAVSPAPAGRPVLRVVGGAA
ncbi:hypothetical protein [Streptomyces caniscabiei]|uniref:hypothetical protein n=1 Tax=Streptomyces caniscabiei TaxID=2746961 RepID=UPI0029BB142D|nr:hypothetical protein [Streptomyces caniscabiei]MDX2986522.1 hypothetical protein [Streptomyces caniscabiei]